MGYVFKALGSAITVFLFIMIVAGFFTGLFRGWVGIPVGVFLAVVAGAMAFLTSYGLVYELRNRQKTVSDNEDAETGMH